MAPSASKHARADKLPCKSLASSGLRNTLHGDVFQLKLLMLFLTRGLRAGHKFELGTEMAGVGGKFDDLIFTCENRKSKTITSRYLQAKHKFNESVKITASQLLNESDGDFSLQKYFRSYRDICATLKINEKLQDCIIATNIGFDEEDLRQKGIKLVAINVEDTILDFKKLNKYRSKIPARYKIQAIEGTTDLYDKLEKSSDMHHLVRELLKYGITKKKLELRCDVFKRFDRALVEEKVLDLKPTKSGSKSFHQDFIDDKNLSQNAKEFRKILLDCLEKRHDDSWKTLKFDLSKNFGKLKTAASEILTCDPVNEEAIKNFLDKLVFAVNLPNETQLGRIISNEMGMDFNLLDSRPVSNNLLIKMLNWFKEKSATMLSTLDANSYINEAKQMMVSIIHATGASIDYRKQLCKYMKFNQDAIDTMTKELKYFLYSTSTRKKKVLHISTGSSKCTAIIIVQLLKQLTDFKKDDSYLIVPSKNLRREVERDRMRNILGAKKSHYLLVVVCNDTRDNELKWHDLIPENRKWKRIIIIGTNISKAGMQDTFYYRDLNRKTEWKLRSKRVQFQGSEMKVKTLLDKSSEPNAIINLPSFQEVIGDEIVNIPAPRTRLAPGMAYIERQLEFPSFDENFCKQLAQESRLSLEGLALQCRFDPALSGNIEWFVSGPEQVNIWERMKKILNDNTKGVSSANRQEDHFVDRNWKSRIMIISNVAGTGKSTLLSRYFNLIKCNNSDHWVIRLDLVKYTKAISSTTSFNQKKAIKFLLEIPGITGKSSFAKSMLKHRLKVAGRVVLMLDGFDEISSDCQDNTIQFIKAIIQTKLERLYITTRPHLKYKLEDTFLQFAFNLQNFSEKDQMDYLTATWMTNLNISDPNEVQTIEEFAKSLVNWFTQSLNDYDRAFIGIPLQCRMLAECYQSKLENVMANVIDSESAFNDDDKFSLSELYHRFMETKRKVFLDEKVMNAGSADRVTNYSVRHLLLQKIANRLLELAIKTMFTKPEDVILLWQDPPLNNLSEEQHELNEKELDEHCIRHGLVNGNGEDDIQFLHRTFAEYLVAQFIFNGFNIDDRKRTKLLDSESVSEFIFAEILGRDYQHVGVRTFLNSMLHEIVAKRKTEWQIVLNESSSTLIDQTNLSPLQKFVLRFSITNGAHWIVPSNTRPYPILLETKDMTSYALTLSSINEGNANIFKFLWDCLKTTNEKRDVQKIACNLMKDINLEIRSAYYIMELLGIYTDADTETVVDLLNEWCLHYKVEYMNNDEKKKTIQCILRFIKKHKEILPRRITLKNVMKCCNDSFFFRRASRTIKDVLTALP